MCGTALARHPSIGDGDKAPKVKEKRRNSDKRKEKSRDAARSRRGRESEIFRELCSYLPITDEVASQLDKMSVLRLTLNTLKLDKFLDPFRSRSNDGSEKDWLNVGEGEESLSNDPIFDFFDGFMIIFMELSSQLEAIYASVGIQTHLGVAPIEILGVPMEDFIHPCDYEELKHVFQNLKSTKDEDDREAMLQVRMKCTITPKGRVINIKSASYKVVKLQMKLVVRDGEFHLIAVCEPVGAFMAKLRPARKTFLTSDVNPKCEFTSQHELDLKFKMVENIPPSIGYISEQLRGKSLYDVIHAADIGSLSGHFKDLFAKGYCHTGFYRILARTGGYVWISTKAQLLQDNLGKPQTVHCVHYALSRVQNTSSVLDLVQQESLDSETTIAISSPLPSGQKPSQYDPISRPYNDNAIFPSMSLCGNAAAAAVSSLGVSSPTDPNNPLDGEQRIVSASNHVLIFVPSGPGQSDHSAIIGQRATQQTISTPSIGGRYHGGVNCSTAGGQPKQDVALSHDSVRRVATLVSNGGLVNGQTSPVAVVGQSKNNQLDNNNSGELLQAVCASLPLASYSGLRVEGKQTECPTAASLCEAARSCDCVPGERLAEPCSTRIVTVVNNNLRGDSQCGDQRLLDIVPDIVSSAIGSETDTEKSKVDLEERELTSQVRQGKNNGTGAPILSSVLIGTDKLLSCQLGGNEEPSLIQSSADCRREWQQPQVESVEPKVTLSTTIQRQQKECTRKPTSIGTSTLSVFALRTEEMSPGFLQIKGGQVLTCEEPGLDLTHLAPNAGDSSMPLEVEFEISDEIPENLFPSLLDSAGCSPLSCSPPYGDPMIGCSDLPPALLDDIHDNLQLETDHLLLASDWPLAGSSFDCKSNGSASREKAELRQTFRNCSTLQKSSSSKPLLAALLQSDLVPASVSQKQRAMVHDWGGTTQQLEPDKSHSHRRDCGPPTVKFVPQKVQSTLTINALKRPISVSQRSSLDSPRPSLICPLKRRKTSDNGELVPKPVEKSGSVLMKLLVNGEDLTNGYSCRIVRKSSQGSTSEMREKELRSAQDLLCSLASQLDYPSGSVSPDSDFCHLLSADDDLLMALAAVTQE